MHGRIRGFGVVAVVAAALGTMAAGAQADTNLGTAGGITYMQDLSGSPTAPPYVVGAKAACPGGMHVVGGGFGGSGVFTRTVQFWVNGTRPFDGADVDRSPDDGWTGRGFNRFGANKRGIVLAMCTSGTVRYRSNRRSLGPGSAGAVRAACPAGTHVSGGGAGLGRSATQAFVNTSVPYDSNDADSRPDDGWRARAYNQGGPTKSLSVHAACVSPLPRYVSESSTSSDEGVASMCPASTHAMGGGGTIGGAVDRAWLSAVAPIGTSGSTPDDGFLALIHRTDPVGYAGFVICKA